MYPYSKKPLKYPYVAGVLEASVDHDPRVLLPALIPVTPLLLEMSFSPTGPLLGHLSQEG